MPNSDATLKSVLSGLGANVYQDVRPADQIPAIVYRKIGQRDFMSHAGRVNKSLARYQVIAVGATRAVRESLMESIENVLIGNTTNFNAAWASEIYIQDKEADNIFSASRDFFVFD